MGQSGSVIWFTNDNSAVIFSIHTGGSNKYKYNVATIINDTIFNNIMRAIVTKGLNFVPRLAQLNPNKPHRVLMVLGRTGCGKTTTLNCMMNYLWGVEFKDPYRYKLRVEKPKQKGQSDSQTDDVTAYNLEPPALGYQLTVIDTPGYGDTRGIERDKLITKNIKEFFDKEVQDIDAVCFVIRAPQARLTATQKYIFAQVLSIFGKDIEDNIFILLTFADGKK
eukprot:524408_1